MDDDIPDFAPVNRPLVLSKEIAAARQTQFAVMAFKAGDYDAAITLAGAAEGMLPGDPDLELSTKQISDEKALAKLGKKLWVQTVHVERDWLKHPTHHLDDELRLDFDNAPFPVYRAIRKLPLELITIEMLSFEAWYRDWVEQQIAARTAEAG